MLKSAYDSNSKYSKLTSDQTLYRTSDYYLESGAFVKIDNVSLGYTQPLKSKYMKSVRLYAVGRNLHTFSQYSSGDPELININGMTPGIKTDSQNNPTLNYYPSTLQLIFGLQATF